MISWTVLLVGLVMLEKTASKHGGKSRMGGRRVVHGSDDARERHPFVVVVGVVENMSLPLDYARDCTAALVHAHWALTAASCARSCAPPASGPYIPVVIYGDLTAPMTNDYRRIIECIPHPHYSWEQTLHEFSIRTNLRNDVGLVQMEPLEAVAPARLLAADYRALTGLPVTYVGTGLTVSSEQTLGEATRLLMEDQRRKRQIGKGVITKCSIENKSGSKMVFEPVLCVRPECSRRDELATKGDAGSPLLVRGKIVGVFSAQVPHQPNALSVFTAVSPFLDWIQSTIQTKELIVHRYRYTS